MKEFIIDKILGLICNTLELLGYSVAIVRCGKGEIREIEISDTENYNGVYYAMDEDFRFEIYFSDDLTDEATKTLLRNAADADFVE